MIYVRKATSNMIDKFWLDEAFMFNKHRYNYHDVNELELDNFFIVHKDNKDIGFFVLYIDHVHSEVSSSYWAHPRFCRMNMLPIIQCAAVGAVHYGKALGMNNLMLRITEGLPCRLIRKMYSGIDTYKLKPGLNLCYGNLSSIKLNNPIVNIHEDNMSFEVSL